MAAAFCHIPCTYRSKVGRQRGRHVRVCAVSAKPSAWRYSHHLGACRVGTALKGASATTNAYPDHHPFKRLEHYLSASAFLGGVPPPNPPHSMPCRHYLPAIPPLPHPDWAQPEPPAVRVGRLKALFPPRPAGGPGCTHVPCALPPRGWAPRLHEIINMS